MKHILRNHGVVVQGGNFAVQHPAWNAVNPGRAFMKIARGGMPLHNSMHSLSTDLVSIYRRVQTITEANRDNVDLRRNGEQLLADIAARIGNVQAKAHTRGVDPRLSGTRTSPANVASAIRDLSAFLTAPTAPMVPEQELQLIRVRLAAAFGTAVPTNQTKETAQHAPDEVVARIDALVQQLEITRDAMTSDVVKRAVNTLIDTLNSKRNERGFAVEGDVVSILNLIHSNMGGVRGNGSGRTKAKTDREDIDLVNEMIRSVGQIKISQPERMIDVTPTVTVPKAPYTVDNFDVVQTSWPKARGLAALGSAAGIGIPLAKWIVIPLVSFILGISQPSAPAPREVPLSGNERPAVVQPVQQASIDKFINTAKKTKFWESDMEAVLRSRLKPDCSESEFNKAYQDLLREKGKIK